MAERTIYRAAANASKRTRDGRTIVVAGPITAYGETPHEAKTKLAEKFQRRGLAYVGSIRVSEA